MSKNIDRKTAQGYFSEYLSSGYKTEQFHFEDMLIHQSSLQSLVVVDKPYVPNETELYHYTAPVTMIHISQLAILYACFDNNMEEKEGEFFMRNFHIQCKSEINLRRIPLYLSVDNSKQVDDYILYQGSFSVSEGSFVGDASFIMPYST